MYMQNYELQWLFHLKYNRKLKQASIKSSKHFDTSCVLLVYTKYRFLVSVQSIDWKGDEIIKT
jgi:hypothetical protein